MIEVKGKATLDGSGWEAGINKISSSTNKFATIGLGALKSQLAAAFGAGAILALSKKTIDYAGHINDLSQQLGVSVEKLQEFDFAAKQNGASVDTFASFLEKLASARAKALEGNEDLKNSFKEFGIEVADLKGKRLDELTSQIANRVKDADVQKIVAPLKEIGGKGAGQLIATFKAGLDEAGEEARESGVIMKESVVQQLDEIGDRFGKLGQQMMAYLAPAIAFVADAFQAFLDMLNKGAAYLGALTANMDFGKILRTMFDPREWLKGNDFASEIGRQFGESEQAANQAVEKVEKEIIQREERIIKSREESKNRALFTEDIEGDGTKKENKVKEAKAPEIKSDSLLKVGNFLGSNGASSIVAVQKSQLTVLRNIDKTMMGVLKNTANAGSPMRGFNLDANTP